MILERCGKTPYAEDIDLCCGKLEGQRHPLEPATNFQYIRNIVAATGERRS
jgi:hypothetical protein